MKGLEQYDPRSGRWVLYQSEADHSRERAQYPYESIPARIFLDTNVVNALVKHAAHIFEHEPLLDGLHQTLAHDIEASTHAFQTRLARYSATGLVRM